MAGDTVYAVASGKGGVGKTTTTVNLGAALAGFGHPTVVVDCDLAMANLAPLVSLGTDDVTLHDVLTGEASLEDATYRLADGIAAVPSPANLDAYSDLEPRTLEDVVAALRSAFEYVLLDVGAGVGRETVLPLGLADETILVVTPDPAAVQDAEKASGLVDRAGGNVAGVVVTRVRDDDESAPPAIADRMGMTLLGTVPEDEAVRESVRAGRPVVVHAPDSPAATAYRRLAASIAGDDDGDRPSGASSADAEGSPAGDAEDPSDADSTAGDDDAGDDESASGPGERSTGDDTPEASPSEISEALADLEDDGSGR